MMDPVAGGVLLAAAYLLLLAKPGAGVPGHTRAGAVCTHTCRFPTPDTAAHMRHTGARLRADAWVVGPHGDPELRPHAHLSQGRVHAHLPTVSGALPGLLHAQ